MTKTKLLILVLAVVSLGLKAQDDGRFVLTPPIPEPLLPGQSCTFVVKHYDIINDIPFWNDEDSDITSVVNYWLINGHDTNHLLPGDGSVLFGNSAENAKTHLTYTAPTSIPSKNPVVIAVRLNTKDNSEVFLVANVTIIKADYKISMTAEETGPEGIHYKLTGESFTNLNPLSDGTFMLAPGDGSRDMYITVQDATAAETGDASAKLLSPKQFTIPFLFTIGNMGKTNSDPADGIFYLYTTSPKSGQVIWKYTGDDKTIKSVIDLDKGIISYAGHPTPIPGFSPDSYTDGITNLDLMKYISVVDVMSNVARNADSAGKQMEMAEKMQAHMNDPAYFQTPEGKKVLQEFLSMQQQVGSNIDYSGQYTKNQMAAMAEKARDSSGYAGSKELDKDWTLLLGEKIHDKFRYEKSPMAQVTPGAARARIEDTFNPNSSTAFKGSLEGSQGPVNVTFKVTVEKIR